MIFILGIIYLLAFYLSIFKPPYFLILFGVIGSTFDAFGIGSYFATFFSAHFTFMYVLFYLSLIKSLSKYFMESSKKYFTIIITFLTFSLIMALSIFLYYLTNPLVSTSVSQIIMNIIYLTTNFSLLGVIILLTNFEKYNIKNLLIVFISIQLTIAILVIYLPNFGINILSVIDGSNYQPKQVHSSLKGATPFNFIEVLGNKYYFNKFAQFHNSNDTGFYFGIGLFLCIDKFLVSRYSNKFYYLLPCFFMIIFWSNSGMRAPIVGIIFSLIIKFLFVRLTLKKLTTFFLTLPFVFSLFFIPTIQEIIIFSLGLSQESKISYTSRASLIDISMDFFKKNYLLGNGGRVNELSIIGVSPHFLPLKLAVMFGVATLIISLVCIYVIPALHIFKNMDSFYTYGLIIIIWLVSFTDNYTCIVLFNFVLASALYNENIGERNENFNFIRL
ncbi:hypothetical protein [Vagococcus fluvialis]|uniref:hypothetical protein n=1 Tax=Vagococcus fluvialis TaxID=2738 RepID=UPI0037D451CE